MTDLFEATPTTTSLDLRRQQREVRRRQRRVYALAATAIGMVVLAIGASFSWNYVNSFGGEEVGIPDFPGTGQGQVQVVISSGDNGEVIAQTLYENGVIKSTEAFTQEWANNPETAEKIQPGYYVIQKEMKAEFAMIALLDRSNRIEVRITIPEGWRSDQILQKVADLTGFTLEEVEAAAEDTDALGLPAEAEGNLEGWLFPATYTFDPGVEPEEVLSRMVTEMVRNLDDLEIPDGQRVRALTIASLVEREAKLDDDRALISGVIHNRLDAGMPLELDSTAHYVHNAYGDVFTTAEQRAASDPYNTYKYPGLPPGPIAAPGRASLEAAKVPASHDYRFFVTVNLVTGETLYSKTYSGHLDNVQVLQNWLRENR